MQHNICTFLCFSFGDALQQKVLTVMMLSFTFIVPHSNLHFWDNLTENYPSFCTDSIHTAIAIAYFVKVFCNNLKLQTKEQQNKNYHQGAFYDINKIQQTQTSSHFMLCTLSLPYPSFKEQYRKSPSHSPKIKVSETL